MRVREFAERGGDMIVFKAYFWLGANFRTSQMSPIKGTSVAEGFVDNNVNKFQYGTCVFRYNCSYFLFILSHFLRFSPVFCS